MKIAIIGTGIAGNYAAWRLTQQGHDITVFESGSRIGGHCNTVRVSASDGPFDVDTGFIVFNNRTYPHFVELLETLGVGWQDSDMSFSVKHERTGLEYNGSSLNGLFARRSNLLRPSFHRMIRDILRFNRDAPALRQWGDEDLTLGDYLEQGKFGRAFVEHYIVPMGSAIWSATQEGLRDMPATFFVRFFQNHGLLSLNDRPQWRVIEGGSATYVDRLVEGHRHRIQLHSPVEAIQRFTDHVRVKVRGAAAVRFDHVFVACHSDEALSLLADPSDAEREVLGAIAYQDNEAVLHTDTLVLPRRRLARAAWNYHLLEDFSRPAAVTYNMNILQGLRAKDTYCVTLNHTVAIDERKIIDRFQYAHPVFNAAAIRAQQRHAEINIGRRTHYCGAYWRYGFHEDGVVSARAALEHFAEDQQHAQRDLQRTG